MVAVVAGDSQDSQFWIPGQGSSLCGPTLHSQHQDPVLHSQHASLSVVGDLRGSVAPTVVLPSQGALSKVNNRLLALPLSRIPRRDGQRLRPPPPALVPSTRPAAPPSRLRPVFFAPRSSLPTQRFAEFRGTRNDEQRRASQGPHGGGRRGGASSAADTEGRR